jgi:hypothetical protein
MIDSAFPYYVKITRVATYVATLVFQCIYVRNPDFSS